MRVQYARNALAQASDAAVDRPEDSHIYVAYIACFKQYGVGYVEVLGDMCKSRGNLEFFFTFEEAARYAERLALQMGDDLK